MYDMFMFLNENDLLELRINQHWDFVEKFIIIEAGQTHSGNSKGYNFDTERFEKYKEKIIYVQHDSLDDLIEQHPELLDYDTHHFNVGPQNNRDTWKRENIQINSGMLTLHDLEVADDDLVNWGGLDEMMRKESYDIAVKQVFENPEINRSNAIVGFELSCYAYKFNLYHQKTGGCGLATYGLFKKYLPGLMRISGLSQGLGTHYQVPNGGWHFCSVVKDSAGLLYKYKNFAHAAECTDASDELRAIQKVFDDYQLKPVEIDESYPRYLVENLQAYKDYIY